jgi:hypothetical protein
MKNQTNSSFLQYLQKVDTLFLFFGINTLMVTASILIINNNGTRSAPIFLFLLVLGAGFVSFFGLIRGGGVAIVLVAGMVLIKQGIGIWNNSLLFRNVMELITILLAYYLIGALADRLHRLTVQHRQATKKLRVLEIEDKGVGLPRPAIGILRLKEEEERSRRFNRPFSLVLIHIQPRQNVDWKPGEATAIMRAVATAMRDTTRYVDIPFLASSNEIGLLLPETDNKGANKVFSNVRSRMISSQYLTAGGTAVKIYQRARIRFGFASFLGYSDQPIDLMAAARKSLEENIQTNIGSLFQNVFLDWETVGTPVVSSAVVEG